MFVSREIWVGRVGEGTLRVLVVCDHVYEGVFDLLPRTQQPPTSKHLSARPSHTDATLGDQHFR